MSQNGASDPSPEHTDQADVQAEVEAPAPAGPEVGEASATAISEDTGQIVRIELDVLLKRVSTVPETSMRIAELRRWIRYGSPEVVAADLHRLMGHCVNGLPSARLAQLCFVRLLLSPEAEDDIALTAIDLAAEQTEAELAVLLLTDPPPQLTVPGRARKNLELRGAVPLGRRKAWARLSNQKRLSRLIYDPAPSVVEILCQNPRLTVHHLVSMTAKRPNWTDVLDTIARSRWLDNRTVQEALIQNCYARTGLAIALLPQRDVRFLSTMCYASDLHPAVRQAAETLLEYRGDSPQTLA